MANEAKRMREPTIEPSGGVLPTPAHPATIGETEQLETISVLQGYFNEADNARKGGLNPRDDKWQQNLDLYWNRMDFSAKARWQAKETMPEVPSFVDRFAAALKEALVSTPEGFYTVTDPADVEGDITGAIKRMTDVWLSTAGRNQMGQYLSFSSVFEEQTKLGAIMAMSSVVTWKEDSEFGRVAVETVDPRSIWLDPTYRNLYRIRRTELDVHELRGLANSNDNKGKPIFDLEELANLTASVSLDMKKEREELTGVSQEITSTRKPIVLDEYIATVVNTDGSVRDKALYVLANNRFLIRGPEKNPFWHGRDWVTYAPLVTAPLSPYGRSYMEDFGAVAKTFTELTNMILDAVHTSTLKAWAVVPGMLLNPQQLAEGITPNKAFLLEDGFRAEDFAKALELGTLPMESITVWNSLKKELSEAAGINEIGLGQFAPKGRTSATEVSETQQSSSALIRSVAQTVETRWLDPTLDLVWKTGLQHMKPDDTMLAAAAGPEMFMALISRRKELISRPITFQARGISQLIMRAQQLKALMQVLSVMASNEVLLKAFLEEVDVKKLVERLFALSNIDLSKLKMTEREQMMKEATQPLMQAQEGAQGAPGAAPSDGALGQIKEMAKAMGAGKQ